MRQTGAVSGVPAAGGFEASVPVDTAAVFDDLPYNPPIPVELQSLSVD